MNEWSYFFLELISYLLFIFLQQSIDNRHHRLAYLL